MKTNISKVFNDLLFYFNEQEEQTEEEASPEGEEAYQEEYQEEQPGQGQPEQGQVEEYEEASPEEQLSDVDKVYRLKKLYAKLIAVSKILDNYSDVSFDDLQKKILEAVDLFHIIIFNYDVFKDKINPIIKSFEKLLEKAVNEIEMLANKNKEM